MQLHAKLKLSHLNVRREKEGAESGPVAVDIKLTGQLPLEACASLFATKAGYTALLARLYRTDGELVSSDLQTMTLSREGVGVAASLQSDLGNVSLVFEGAQFNKLRLSPLAGRVVEFSGRLQVKPNDGQLSQLGTLLSAEVTASIAQRQSELVLEAPMQAGDGTAESGNGDADGGDAQPESGNDQIPLEDSRTPAVNGEKMFTEPADAAA